MKEKKDPVVSIWDQRMLKLMEYCVQDGQAESQYAFLRSIGYASPNNVSKVREGLQGFRPEHFQKAGELYNVSMDWLYGFTNQRARKAEKRTSGIDLIKEGLRILEKK